MRYNAHRQYKRLPKAVQAGFHSNVVECRLRSLKTLFDPGRLEEFFFVCYICYPTSDGSEHIHVENRFVVCQNEIQGQI